jgi:phospholipase C
LTPKEEVYVFVRPAGARLAAPYGWHEPGLVNLGAPVTSAQALPKHSGTATPIKHDIVIIGENRTFDHVFATYQPKRREAVSNGSNRTVP